MTEDKELDDLLEEGRVRTENTPHVALILHNYKQLGADRYERERFYRLCAAWRETPAEMAARIGMSVAQLNHRLRRGYFNSPGCFAESILLSQFERFIEWHHTGAERPNELFVKPR